MQDWEDREVEKIRSEFDKLCSAITVTTPFISSLLRRLRIVLSRKIETMTITKKSVVMINPDFWLMLSYQSRAWLLGHATLHTAFRDHKRIGSRNKILWTISADAVNNTMQAEFIRIPPKELQRFIITMYHVLDAIKNYHPMQIEELEKMTKEEVYKILADGADISISVAVDLDADVEAGGEDVTLQEGDPQLYNEDGEEVEDAEELWKERIAQAYSAQKMAGKVPAGLKRIVDELLKSKVDWRALLNRIEGAHL